MPHNTTVPFEPDSKAKSSLLEIIIGATVVILLAVGFAILAYVFIPRIKRNYKSSDDNEEMPRKKSKQTDARKQERLGTSKRIPIASIVSGKVSMPSMDEFQKLIQYDGEIGQRFTTAQGMRYNKTGQFNLIPTNLPFDQFLV